MGFHGYEHNSGIIGEWYIAECVESPPTQHPNIDSTSYGQCRCHSHHHSSNRLNITPCSVDGPVDLSRFGTPTPRGTWSIGGRRISPRTSLHLQFEDTSDQDIIRGVASLAIVPSPSTAERTADSEKPDLCQSDLNASIAKVMSKREDDKADQSIGDTDEVETGCEAAAICDLIKAKDSSISLCHDYSHMCTKCARVVYAQESSVLSPRTGSCNERMTEAKVST